MKIKINKELDFWDELLFSAIMLLLIALIFGMSMGWVIEPAPEQEPITENICYVVRDGIVIFNGTINEPKFFYVVRDESGNMQGIRQYELSNIERCMRYKCIERCTPAKSKIGCAKAHYEIWMPFGKRDYPTGKIEIGYYVSGTEKHDKNFGNKIRCKKIIGEQDRHGRILNIENYKWVNEYWLRPATPCECFCSIEQSDNDSASGEKRLTDEEIENSYRAGAHRFNYSEYRKMINFTDLPDGNYSARCNYYTTGVDTQFRTLTIGLNEDVIQFDGEITDVKIWRIAMNNIPIFHIGPFKIYWDGVERRWIIKVIDHQEWINSENYTTKGIEFNGNDTTWIDITPPPKFESPEEEWAYEHG